MRARVRSVLRSSVGLSGVRGVMGVGIQGLLSRLGRKDGITIRRRRAGGGRFFPIQMEIPEERHQSPLAIKAGKRTGGKECDRWRVLDGASPIVSLAQCELSHVRGSRRAGTKKPCPGPVRSASPGWRGRTAGRQGLILVAQVLFDDDTSTSSGLPLRITEMMSLVPGRLSTILSMTGRTPVMASPVDLERHVPALRPALVAGPLGSRLSTTRPCRSPRFSMRATMGVDLDAGDAEVTPGSPDRWRSARP